MNFISVFTKQDAEMESDSAPPCIKKPVMFPMSNLIPNKESSSIKPKLVTFNGSTPTSIFLLFVLIITIEDYPNSPRKYLTGPMGNQTLSLNKTDSMETEIEKLGNELQENLNPDISNSEKLSESTKYIERHILLECVETQPTKPNVSILTCSVDVEPSGSKQLSKTEFKDSNAHCAELPEIKVVSFEEDKSETPNEIEPDVLDRISHDLDYLLNRTEVSPYINYDEAASSITKVT